MSTGGFPQHNVPWAPRPVVHHPRPFAFFYAALGRARDWLVTELGRRFGQASPYVSPLSPQQIGRLANFALQIQERFSSFFDVDDTHQIPRALIPRGGIQPRAYRFIVNVTIRNLRTGETDTHAVVIDSDRNLTARQVGDEASRLALQLYVSDRTSPFPGQQQDPYEIVRHDLMEATRAT